jgi:predicted nucleic acid-binding protein
LSDLVVDASAAVHLALMTRLPAGLARYTCVAPPLMWSEALSALVEGAFRGDIPPTALDEAFERLEALRIAVAVVDVDHRRRTLELARSLGWAKSYDAEYVALAQAQACPVLTVDVRLTRGASHLVEIIGPAALQTR